MYGFNRLIKCYSYMIELLRNFRCFATKLVLFVIHLNKVNLQNKESYWIINITYRTYRN